MVFRMLKGLKRLMLTTGLMCGVGLFLCATDVKAAATVAASLDRSGGDPGFRVNVNFTTDADDKVNITEIVLFNDKGQLTSITTFPDGTNPMTSTNNTATVTQGLTDKDVLKNASNTVISDYIGSEIPATYATVKYDIVDGATGQSVDSSTVSVTTAKKIYQAKAITDTSYTTSANPGYTISLNDGINRADKIGYDGTEYAVETGVSNSYYYEIGKADATKAELSDTDWIISDGTMKWPGTLSSTGAEKHFDFFPAVSSIKLMDQDGVTYSSFVGTKGAISDKFTENKPYTFKLTYKLLAASGSGTDDSLLSDYLITQSPQKVKITPTATKVNSYFTDVDTFNLKAGGVDLALGKLTDETKEATGLLSLRYDGVYGESKTFDFDITGKLEGGTPVITPAKNTVTLTAIGATDTVGVGLSKGTIDKAKLNIKSNSQSSNVSAEKDDFAGGVGIKFTALKTTTTGTPAEIVLSYDGAEDVTIKVTVTDEAVKPTGIEIYDRESITKTPVATTYLAKGAEGIYDIGFVPTGVDVSEYDYIEIKGSADNKFSVTPSTDKKAFKIVAKDYTTKTENVTVYYKGHDDIKPITAVMGVVVADITNVIDSTKTKENITKAEYNYITIGDDFSLDLEALLKDNVCDKDGNKLNLAPSWVKITSGDDYASLDGKKLKGKKAGTVKISAGFYDDKITDVEGIEIGVYPMPTAEYKDRTVALTLPGKVATSYKGDNTISEVKGFKIALTDGSGNVLYEYDASKYQTVLSDSSSTTKTYTVSASDIEAMVTNAASAGKFAADTTSVQFRVIPMGYKPLKSDKSITTASDKIKATCQTTVYRVSAVGENIAPSYAYGLDGQTVQLTANVTDPTKYAFKQWQDNSSASNPRSIKISASGNRNYQAVAGARNGSGAGNGTGTGSDDNSELYDKVPKTAESNSAIWLIIFMVFAVMGTTYALYLQLRAASSKNDK